MKKTHLSLLGVLALLIALSALLAGCGCKHVWKEATCDTPKTCTECNATEGEAAGHKWQDATCETAKVCSVCNKTDGKALGHDWKDATCESGMICANCNKVNGEALGHEWVAATCEAPKTCGVCQKTEGNALGHNWTAATCETPKTCSVCQKTEGNAAGHNWAAATCEAPKTCTVCSVTEGEAAGHKWVNATMQAPQTCSACGATVGSPIADARFDPEACKDLIGSWNGTLALTGEETGIEGFTGVLELSYTLYFGGDGSYREVLAIANKDAFLKALEDDLTEAMYAEFAKQGLTQAQADAAMKATYGMDTRAYAKQIAASTNWDAVYNTTVIGVYYVSGNLVYSGENWSAYLVSDTYSIQNNVLTIASISNLFPNLQFTKVS